MSFATANGQAITRMSLHVGQSGPWFADIILDSTAESVAGKVTISVNGVTLTGTAIPAQTGTYGDVRHTRVVGGSGAWGTLLKPKDYHSDGGVQALLVAQDAARDAGEVLGTFTPQNATIGIDYVRQSGPASRVLEEAIGSATWWVGYDGITLVGTRASNTPSPDSYEVTGYDPRAKIVTVQVDQLDAITVGSTITKNLDSPQTVRDLEIELSHEGFSAKAWCGPTATSGRLVSLLRGVIDRSTDKHLYGIYRFRVIKMDSDRVQLQSVSNAPGLPDLLPISMFPGAPGISPQLTPGSEVLLQFVAGNRSEPIITGFTGPSGPGYAPVSMTLEVSTSLALGGGLALGGTGGSPVALSNLVESAVTAAITGHTHAGPGSPGVLGAPVASTGATKVTAT